jgi:cytochrome c553
MNKIHIIGLFSAILLFSCSNESNNAIARVEKNPNSENSNIPLISSAIALDRLSSNCYACHNPNSESHDDILAPPLAGIKHKYKKQYPNEQEFIAQMSGFIDLPTKEKALMKGPVKRFGVMPKTTLSKTEIQELVKYIYNNPLESPEWFAKHFEEKHGEK